MSLKPTQVRHPLRIPQELSRRAVARVREKIWRVLRLEYTLRSGVSIVVRNPSDWVIYNEILVNGEYDRAITRAIETSDRAEFRVLDLGANVGYFVMRCADLFLQSCRDKKLVVVAVEGSPETHQELRARIESQDLLRGTICTVNGLVGERVGSARISNYVSHFGNSVIAEGNTSAPAVSVPYVDLSNLHQFANGAVVDLLKCDIEGSEYAFLRNYADFLTRVRVAVFEFHKYGENVDEYRELLESYGLKREAVLRETSQFAIELYCRQVDRQPR